MTIYIIDKDNICIKDVILSNLYSTERDVDFNGKTQITIPDRKNIAEGDFVVLKDGSSPFFAGICSEIQSQSEAGAHAVTLVSMENLFDQRVFPDNEEIISETGLEDYIARVINDNWINSGDPMMDKSFIEVRAATHTKIQAKISTIGTVEEGTFNFKTFLGNCLEYYGVRLEFVFSTEDGALYITVRKDSADPVPVDLTLLKYTEEKQVDVLAKLKVKWSADEGKTTTDREYYLRTDRSVTDNKMDPTRAAGKVSSIYIESQSEAEMMEKVTQQFKSNSYSHKITFTLDKDSRLFDSEDFYIGRSCIVKTKSGTRETIITKRTESNNSKFVTIVFGKLKVTLIDKLRGAR